MIEENAKQLLFDIDDIMKKIDLKYFLYAGTCLGAVRESRFIPIDLDVDIACLQEDFLPKAQRLNEELIASGFETQWIDHRHKRPWNGEVYAIKVRKYGENCDIVGLIKRGKYRFNPSHIDTPMFVHTGEYCEDFEPVDFYGREFLVPKDPSRFLGEHYGDWKTPHTEFYKSLDVFPTAKFPKGENDYWWAE